MKDNNLLCLDRILCSALAPTDRTRKIKEHRGRKNRGCRPQPGKTLILPVKVNNPGQVLEIPRINHHQVELTKAF